jgi:hypothetical protein
MRAVREVNRAAGARRLLFTGPAPQPPKGSRRGAALLAALDVEKLDGEDLLDPEEDHEVRGSPFLRGYVATDWRPFQDCA